MDTNDDRSEQRADQQPLTTADVAAAAERRDQPAGDAAVRTDREARIQTEREANVPVERETARTIRDERIAEHPSLFPSRETEEFRSRWATIQTNFVDEPRQSVEQADALVAAAIKRLAEIFAHERDTLEQQWSRGDEISTEDLRLALQRYRAFFDRLLSV